MRPYMLWLTRVYGRSIVGYGTAFMHWPNILDDWLRRCAEDRFRNERALRDARRLRSGEFLLFDHKSKTSGIRRPATASRGVPNPPRAAGQGER